LCLTKSSYYFWVSTDWRVTKAREKVKNAVMMQMILSFFFNFWPKIQSNIQKSKKWKMYV